jgi:carbamoyl-phosphate synthase large subunit
VRENGGADPGAEPWAPQAKGRLFSPSQVRSEAMPAPPVYAVKAPVFSFQKLAMVEPALGPEMKSTGEVLGIDSDLKCALFKALIASGIDFKARGQVILTVADADKPAAVEIGRRLSEAGYKLAATGGTHEALQADGISSDRLQKLDQGTPTILDRLFRAEVSLMINTPGPESRTGDAARIRRACIETGVACVTSIETAQALADALEAFENPDLASCRSLDEHLRGPEVS